MFFVIKSYREDDIHKSIKYSVWSSTLNGNKKLDSAYQESQKKVAEKSGTCHVFLFFSVNASGQFCGVAEMTGRVDYEKSMDFWQQDKWTGYFPVKWHIIKDVPNPQLRHVILENNENKPVTNSRDTQVRLLQGSEVLNIFKNYVAKTSILDDFEFYENREKVMVQKKLRFPPVQIKKKEEDLVADFQTVEISKSEKHTMTETVK
ncbi:evolutionarily conserved C-terminal region 8 [Raphanus sativus]|nr:evolutionarily conserved C-terminal region 8 [Raphanus sativus]